MGRGREKESKGSDGMGREKESKGSDRYRERKRKSGNVISWEKEREEKGKRTCNSWHWGGIFVGHK